YVKGNVAVDTPQGLKVKTNNIVYTRRTQVADADEPVEFERDNIKGKSFGATVRVADKQVDLLKDVEIESFESPELMRSGVRYAKLNSASAMFDQLQNRVELNGGISAKIDEKGNSSDIAASRAILFLGGEQQNPTLKKLELWDNVHIVSTRPATTIDAGYALFDKDAQRYELKNGAHVVTTAQDKPTDIRGSEIVFEQAAHKAVITGSGEVTQGADYVKGDAIFADLFDDNKLRHAIVRGNALAKQTTDRTTTVSASEINVSYNDSKVLSDANAIGDSRVEIVPTDLNARYSRVVTTAVRGIGLSFKGEGAIEALRTDGRTTINLNVPNTDAKAANKRLTADTVKTVFQQNGKDIARADAAGNAELYVEPLAAAKENYRTTINAPHFDCEFFPTGNNVRDCHAGTKAKVARERTVAEDGRGTQHLTADELNTNFGETTNGIDRIDAVGNAKFNEIDKNAVAKQISFTDADQMVRLRGGEPTAWDSRARGKAREIDMDMRANKAYMRGGVATTWYSKKAMSDAGPFSSSDKPVFVTSETAEIDNNAQTALYTGGSPRAWQENNYARGDRIAIDQKAGTFRVDGNVQSAVYNAKTRNNGRVSDEPVFATAGSMLYTRDSRVVQYRNSVDVRQGGDRITSEAVDAFLDENNELTKTVAEKNVVVTQSGRRAVGSWVQYTPADDVAILRGDPATVTDAENGTSTGAQMTFSMRDNKIVSEGRAKPNTNGRTRSVYKVKPNQ
ncbi:MAG TPA: LptA/OstA family protein, partial [Pyrinomonadaceae bacterium]|nr:LptA/OstA family protein [Pyrinomonadaceae bacterium]